MKKYIQPSIDVIEMNAAESLLALSIQQDKEADNSTVFSNGKGGWSSDNWSDSEEE